MERNLDSLKALKSHKPGYKKYAETTSERTHMGLYHKPTHCCLPLFQHLLFL